MVNEQTRVGLLLAGPGVIATLSFAPLITAGFYSAKFAEASGILRWICLGATLQVITWPMGFIVVAKGRQNIFWAAELTWAIVAVGLAILCVRSFGLEGAGIAFFGSYIFHGLLIYPIVRRLSGFRWSEENRKTGLLSFFLITLVFCGFYILPRFWAASFGILMTVISAVYSMRVLLRLISLDDIPRPLRSLFVAFGLAPSSSASVN
jgi:PST family polysaccharide transporter